MPAFGSVGMVLSARLKAVSSNLNSSGEEGRRPATSGAIEGWVDERGPGNSLGSHSFS